MKGVNAGSQVWMSHSDTIQRENWPDQTASCLASTHDVENAAYKIEGESDLCHSISPRSVSLNGWENTLRKLFSNDIAGLQQDWTPDSFVDETVADLKAKNSRMIK